MRTRAAILPILIVACITALSGCKLLKKKKKPVTSSDDQTPTLSTFNDIDAVNKADVSRFPDERRLFSEVGFIRQASVARTGPNDTASTVAVLDVDTIVSKQANRFGSTLVTFNRAAFPGQRFAGWVSDTAFFFPPSSPTTTATGPKPPTVTGLPATGDCKLTLRSSGFTPSKATCSFNETIRSGSPATLNFPCAGGAASARFGSQVYTGTADKTRVSMTTSVLSDFKGCSIRTIQTITGSPPNLNYTLSEVIAGGSCAGVSTCTARAVITATAN